MNNQETSGLHVYDTEPGEIKRDNYVKLELSIMQCRTCEGTGYTNETCKRCYGLGFREIEHYTDEIEAQELEQLSNVESNIYLW